MTKILINSSHSSQIVTKQELTTYHRVGLSMTTDEELMAQYQQGEKAAFDLLYKRYEQRVFGYLRRKGLSVEAASEVFQEVWMRLHSTRARYQPELKFAPWIFTLTHHACSDYWRRELKRKESSWEQVPEFPQEEAEVPAAEIPWDKIAKRDREILEMRYLEETDFDEIARTLGLSPTNVRQKISRAIKRLKAKWA